MKYRKILAFLSIIVLLFSGCTKEENPLPPTDEKIKSAINNLSFDMFNYYFETDENLLLSPYSLYESMAMTYNAAGENTESQIKDFFDFASKNENNKNIRDLKENLTKSKEILYISNGIFINKDTIFSSKIDDEFINPLKIYYEAEAKKIAFDNKAVGTINNWVKTKTNNMITKLIDEISKDSAMYILNAIYFKGDWKYQFEEKNTYKRKFNGNLVDMMHLYETEYLYYSDKNIQAIQIPYQDKYAMNIYLTENGRYDNVDLNDLTNKLNVSSVQIIEQLALPKFIYETEVINFNNYLADLDIFSSNTNLDIINKDIFVDSIIQKAKIIVNEKGTEASAVTGTIFKTNASQDHPSFIVDKPFVYTIVHKETSAILFIGYMNTI